MRILYEIGTDYQVFFAAAGIIVAIFAALLSYFATAEKKGLSEEEYKKDQLRGKMRSCVVAILLVLVVMVAIPAVAYYVTADYKKVPDVIELTLASANSRIDAAGLKSVYPKDAEENDTVINQDPEKYAIVPKDTVVTLTLETEPTRPPETVATKPPETVPPTESSTPPETSSEPFHSDVEPGDVLTLGTYAGKPIDWKVLDVQDNKAFLLSTKALTEVKYHNIDHVSVTWDSCSLRSWLNGTFFPTAFTKDEQAAILTTTVDNSADQGDPRWPTAGSGQTKDKLFLLSYAEFIRYVNGTDLSICEAAYSTKTGEDTRVELLDNGKEAAFWWLRSPGDNGQEAAYINFKGECWSNYVTNWYLSVRPAMWIDLDKYDQVA